MNIKNLFIATSFIIYGYIIVGCNNNINDGYNNITSNVDYVNPYMGNIQHMLTPTYPTVSIPNQMLRFYPDRENYTSELMNGLPLIQTSHRGTFAFHISPIDTMYKTIPQIVKYRYDNENITPYSYSVYLENSNCNVEFSPNKQSGIFVLRFENKNRKPYVIINTSNGKLKCIDNSISGYQILNDSSTICYLYMETDKTPKTKCFRDSITGEPIQSLRDTTNGKTIVIGFDKGDNDIKVRYGISYISEEQAKRNLYSQIQTYKIKLTSKEARAAWSRALGKIEIEGGSLEQKKVFYTSLYRVYERMVNISENGKYYSAYDKKVHPDNGIPFYVDDWVWDTFRAVHPLRLLIDPKVQHDILYSYIRMAEQSNHQWLPTFPEVIGDTHRMNGTHTISIFTDAACKNIGDIDFNKAYKYACNTMDEKSYIPWTKIIKGSLSKFLDEKGYFPALNIGEKETDNKVTKWEKRQAVAVTLAACFDYWSLARLASMTGNIKDVETYNKKADYYKNIFNSNTNFFHPKNKNGKFIEPFNYELSGGLGGRDYYDENNGYTYRFDLQQNPKELVKLMGGKENLIKALDQTFTTPISESRFDFLHQFPDQTGNVGQFSMANEPSLHIPYLYNYAGEPWRTQKTIRKLISEWFRDDLMGIPGDEDGGGMSAFVVFSMMGLYPVTPGLPYYNIGSPFFQNVKINLGAGRSFVISAPNCSKDNKYIQSAKLNGKEINRCYIKHSEIIAGGILELEMGNRPNKSWGLEPIPEK